MKKKIAVVLFNLGGPDQLSSVKPFLFNLFNDPAIIGAPSVIRYFLAKLISKRREKTAQEIYSFMGGKSPILEQTINQAETLEKKLKGEENIYKIFISMRYWQPFVNETIKEVINWGPQEVILLPLYPQFSTTTSGSSLVSWRDAALKNKYQIPTKIICCYPTEENFILAHTKSIKNTLNKIKNNKDQKQNIKLLFSAHGLPEKIINKGDPYQNQVEKTVNKIIENINEKEITYTICYQSKVGPLKWIGPSTENEIIKAARDKKTIVLIPIAFVSEHSETLVELDIEYKEIAEINGCKRYYRVPALGINKDFINSLYDLILTNSNNLIVNKKICESKFKECFYNTLWENK
ncbi:MAG: ferrochelatase [Pelagibacterales bacterium]|jgi:ferrochelatase|nr:ferrochelatase [Pelagibacterales bacterium]